jgi:serpin B
MKARILLPLILTAACSQFSPAGPTPAGAEMAQSPRARVAPEVSPAALAAVTGGQRQFAFELYQQLRVEPGNLILSPYSISTAFALAYAGARGDTERELEAVFHYPGQADLHPALNALDRSLSTPAADPATDPTDTPEQDFRLHVANAAWGQRGYSFLPAYLDLLAEHYGAGVRLLDFAQAEAVNGWVSDQTEGRIPDIVSPDIFSADTRLVLANAIYFFGAWVEPFGVQPERLPFTTLDGQAVDVEAIGLTSTYAYTAGDGYQAVAVPYVGGRAEMVLIVPEAGQFEAFESRLDAAGFDALVASLASTEVSLVMPKLDFESRFDLSASIRTLGAETAFSPGSADFSGIDGTRDLSIGRALHVANLTLDENGTEAAAATVLDMVAGAAPVEPTQPIVLSLDRPYLFAIRDAETGAILFLGRVIDPR